jgi:hypothetical protein
MPSTYTLITGETLASSAASYTFTAIPSTFTDLVVRLSVRSDRAGENIDVLKLVVNSNTSTVYSETTLRGLSSSVSSSNTSNATEFANDLINGAASTSDTFASYELYIPSYTVSQNKPMGTFSVQENNSTVARINAIANLFRSTSAVSSLTYSSNTGSNFVSGSSFYLYGIKSS